MPDSVAICKAATGLAKSVFLNGIDGSNKGHSVFNELPCWTSYHGYDGCCVQDKVHCVGLNICFDHRFLRADVNWASYHSVWVYPSRVCLRNLLDLLFHCGYYCRDLFSFCVFTFGPWYPFLEVFILLVSFFRVVRILVPLLKLLVIFLSFGLQGVWIFCSPHCDHPHCLLSSLSNFPFLHLQPLPSEQWLWCWCCWAVQ